MSQRKDLTPRFGDVSIYHYANAAVAGRRGRLTKAVATPITEVEKLVKERVGLRWEQHQKRIEDCDAEDDTDSVKAKTCKVQEGENTAPFLDLPMDIWFAIGDQIPPESVSVFALICKSSYKVTNSARFWFGLYKRYCKPSNQQLLPQRLKPWNMTAIQGLRAGVIRSMYFIYPPFIERLKPQLRRAQDLQVMLHRKCLSTWYTVASKEWTYWFKLKQTNARRRFSSSSRFASNKKLHQIKQDVATNEERDSKVLQFSCPHYIPLPAVQGLFLRRALLTLSQDMMANKLYLTFDNLEFVFDPANNVKILDWWHPQFPHAEFEERKWSNTLAVREKYISDSALLLPIDHWYNG